MVKSMKSQLMIKRVSINDKEYQLMVKSFN